MSDPVTAPAPDAVAQARGKLFRDLVQFYDRDGDTAAADKYVVESVDALIAAVRAECAAKVDVEPELEDRMPDEVWDRMRDSRQASEEMLRATVRVTKRNIRNRILEAHP